MPARSRTRSITAVRGNGKLCCARSGGVTMTIDQNQRFVTLLPSGGYQLVRYYGNEIMDPEPVLGFLVYARPTFPTNTNLRKGMNHSIYPVTAEQVYDGDSGLDLYALILPDGRVDIPEETILPSMEEFQKYVSAQKLKAG